MAIIKASEIPNLSLLYKTHRLASPPAGAALPQIPRAHPNPTESSSPQSAPNPDDPVPIPAPSKALNDRVALFQGSITELELDAIVNAANEALAGGGGVDGAIHRAAGAQELHAACGELDGCDTGKAKVTDGFRLPVKKIIHAVGPRYFWHSKPAAAELLASCYKTSLDLAIDNDCRTIAFCAISTGVYGYPSEDAAIVAAQAVRDVLTSPKSDKFDLVVFVVFEKKDLVAYNKVLPLFFPPVPDVPAASAAEAPADGEADADAKPEAEEVEDAEAEKLAQALPDVPTTDPVGARDEDGNAHVDKKAKRNS